MTITILVHWWSLLTQSVERRAWGQEIAGSGLSLVGGGFHIYSWSQRYWAYVALKLKAEYHAYTNKNVCAWKGERKKKKNWWSKSFSWYIHRKSVYVYSHFIDKYSFLLWIGNKSFLVQLKDFIEFKLHMVKLVNSSSAWLYQMLIIKLLPTRKDQNIKLWFSK